VEKQDHLIDLYRGRVANADLRIEKYKSLSFRYSMVRLSIFILAIPLLYFILKTTIFVFLLCLILVLSLFLWAVYRQSKYDKILAQALAFKAINVNEIDAISAHKNLYYDGEGYKIHNHFYTEDLDIFGPHSLYGLVNRSRTYFGNQMLKNLFLEKTTEEEIRQRQEAVEELKDNIEWRQDFAVRLFDSEELHDFNVAETITQQLSMDMTFATNTFLTLYRRILPFIWITLVVLYISLPQIANTVFAAVFLGNLLLTGKFTKQISAIQGKLSQASGSIKKYVDALASIFESSWKSKLLIQRTSKFETEKAKMPIKSLSELSLLINKLDYRLNFLVAIFLNGFILWDLRIIFLLNTWQKNNEDEITKIFAHIGFMESMSSLATWAYNHPHYSYPRIHDIYLEIEAKDLRHPLIPSKINVGNDFILKNNDRVIIVTGSNMSGKSTFLRTLAINMILGYTGTKTASKSLSIPIVSIVTYMRIKDALEENVSTFKAELNRISMILEVLKTESNAFIFIDEMLRGTNSKDKLNGSIGIVKKMLESSSYSMIATHDIKLAELGKQEDRIANYFFDIDYQNGDLVFDYKIKIGICENFNASFLLGRLGIDTKVKE